MLRVVAVGFFLACGEHHRSPDYIVTTTFPHDTSSYTQGLLYDHGVLYESTGEYGHSTLRRVEVATGRSLASVALPSTRFGEGLALLGDRLYQLTWQSHVGYVWGVSSLALVDSFPYGGEGWGLTTDGTSLIMSDGTDTLRFLDPRTFRAIRKLGVRDGESPLRKVNELELVHGMLLANIYQSDWVVVIDPTTGRIRRWIDFVGLLPDKMRSATTDVLNGIAYDSVNNRLFVTGKRWPAVFEVRLTAPIDSL